jgi:allantoinase
MHDLLVKGGLLVGESGILAADIAVQDGRIAAIAPQIEPGSARRTIDASGLHVMPGGIDPHVHAGDLAWAHREDFAGVSAAAAAGGITTMIEMPQNDPPVVDPASFATKRAAVRARSRIDCGLWGALVPDNFQALEPLWEQGVYAFKAFMVAAKDIAWVDDDTLLAGMARIARFGGLIGIHCESNAIVQAAIMRLKASGRSDRGVHLEARSPEAEIDAVERALRFAETTGVRLHICHLSLGSLLDSITAARRKGVDVTVETCPHYLALCEEDYLRIGPDAKCVPPQRAAGERETLWRGIAAGQIDMVVSDNAPHPFDEKRRGDHDVWGAPNGIQSIQLTLPILLTEGFHARNIGLERIAAMFSTRAAKRFGFYPDKGSLRVGSRADLAIVDVEREWIFQPRDLISKHRVSPYFDYRIKGRVEMTVLSGEVIFHHQSVTAKPGSGRFLTREGAAADN